MGENELEIRLPPEDSYGRIFGKLFMDKRLNTHDLVVYASLRSFGKTCYAGKAAMAARCKCSLRQVHRALKTLEALGYIQKGEIQKVGNFIRQEIIVVPIVAVDTPEYPRECIPVKLKGTQSQIESVSESPKADKLNIESKHIQEGEVSIEAINLDGRVNRCYKKYPSKRSNDSSTGKSLQHKEKIRKILIKTPEYPMEEAIEYHIKSMNGWFFGFSKFLNNLPDPEEFQGGSTVSEEGKCTHAMDWNSTAVSDMGFGQYKGPCIYCGSTIMRTKESF